MIRLLRPKILTFSNLKHSTLDPLKLSNPGMPSLLKLASPFGLIMLSVGRSWS